MKLRLPEGVAQQKFVIAAGRASYSGPDPKNAEVVGTGERAFDYPGRGAFSESEIQIRVRDHRRRRQISQTTYATTNGEKNIR